MGYVMVPAHQYEEVVYPTGRRSLLPCVVGRRRPRLRGPPAALEGPHFFSGGEGVEEEEEEEEHPTQGMDVQLSI